MDQKTASTPFKDMGPVGKTAFVLKVIVCLMTFGMVFPNIGD